jgi:hypothetical protein
MGHSSTSKTNLAEKYFDQVLTCPACVVYKDNPLVNVRIRQTVEKNVRPRERLLFEMQAIRKSLV